MMHTIVTCVCIATKLSCQRDWNIAYVFLCSNNIWAVLPYLCRQRCDPICQQLARQVVQAGRQHRGARHQRVAVRLGVQRAAQRDEQRLKGGDLYTGAERGRRLPLW